MNKNILLALSMMAEAYGERVYGLDLNEDTSTDTDIERCEYLSQYAPIAVEMVDAAYTFNFVYPEDYKAHVYNFFGDWFGDAIHEDDDGEVPDNERCLTRLMELVAASFSQQFKTQEGRDKLQRALQVVADQYTE